MGTITLENPQLDMLGFDVNQQALYKIQLNKNRVNHHIIYFHPVVNVNQEIKATGKPAFSLPLFASLLLSKLLPCDHLLWPYLYQDIVVMPHPVYQNIIPKQSIPSCHTIFKLNRTKVYFSRKPAIFGTPQISSRNGHQSLPTATT